MGIRVEQTKREATAARIIEGIESGRYPRGEQMPFNSDLADEFGVSVGTVSNALYDVQRAGYMEEKSRNESWVVSLAPSQDASAYDALVSARDALAQAKLGLDAASAAHRIATVKVDTAIDVLRNQASTAPATQEGK